MILAAERHARDRAAWRRDLLAALFPAAQAPPEEEVVAATRAALKAMVDSCERDLAQRMQSNPVGLAWESLTQSRLLDDPLLVDSALMLARLRKLDRRGGGRGEAVAPPLLVSLCEREDSPESNAAWALLKADSSFQTGGGEHRQLTAPALNLLCWRVVAALEVGGFAPLRALMREGDALLAEYDEGLTLASTALRLASLLGNSTADLFRPEKAGVALFTAGLSYSLSIPMDLVVESAAERGGMRLAVLLRAVGCRRDAVLEALTWIQSGLTGRELGLQLPDRETALRTVERWTLSARSIGDHSWS